MRWEILFLCKALLMFELATALNAGDRKIEIVHIVKQTCSTYSGNSGNGRLLICGALGDGPT